MYLYIGGTIDVTCWMKKDVHVFTEVTVEQFLPP